MTTRANFKKRICRDKLLVSMCLPLKIPQDASGTYYSVAVYANRTDTVPWGYLRIILRPTMPSTRKSRTFVDCSCGKLIPTGRYHQHCGGASCSGK